MTAPPDPVHTRLWDGTRDLPDWLNGHHHWHDDQLVIHTPDRYTRPEPGWTLILWSDSTVTVASPTLAERVYGPGGIAGRLAGYENRITWNTTCQACARVLDSSIRETERAERAEAALAEARRLHRGNCPVAQGSLNGAVTCGMCEALDQSGPAPAQAAESGGWLLAGSRDLSVPDPTDPTRPAAWTPPPPGDRREQLPAPLLALINIPDYLSTACEAATLLAQQMPQHTLRRIELGEHSDRLHDRCRLQNKFTGVRCRCDCHPTAKEN